MNAAQLAALPPQARAQYFSSLPPAQAAQQQAALMNYVNQQNRDYMKKTVRVKTVCPPASGSGVNQTFATATQLTYTAPVATNGFLEGFIIKINLALDFAAGSSAVYAATKAAEMALIQNITVNYQGTQWNIAPYILKDLVRLLGIYEPTWPNTVLASASHQTTIDTYLSQGALPVSGSNQTVNVEYYCPLNLLHPQDIRGLLPIDGDSTTAQIILQTATNLVGNDPALNPWYAVSGTGQAITAHAGTANTVQVIAVYRNGKTMSQKDALPINFDGIGTVQFQKDVSLTGLANATTLRQKITKLEQHYYALLTVIDGQQATDYSTTANFNYMDLGTDETGSNLFWAYGTGTNLDIREFFTDIRYLLNQDLSQGIVPLAMAPVYNEADPGNRNGSHIMNCDPARNGWSAIHYGIQLATVTSPLSGVTPRVECHLVWVNPRGLVATS
jgi:hypothetical protein